MTSSLHLKPEEWELLEASQRREFGMKEHVVLCERTSTLRSVMLRFYDGDNGWLTLNWSRKEAAKAIEQEARYREAR